MKGDPVTLIMWLFMFFVVEAGLVRGARYLIKYGPALPSAVRTILVALAVPVLGVLAVATVLMTFVIVPPLAALLALALYGVVFWATTIKAPLVPGTGGMIGEGLLFGILFALVAQMVVNGLNGR
jgi:hypothetical protein